jgi:hypothetical protein
VELQKFGSSWAVGRAPSTARHCSKCNAWATRRPSAGSSRHERFLWKSCCSPRRMATRGFEYEVLRGAANLLEQHSRCGGLTDAAP